MFNVHWYNWEALQCKVHIVYISLSFQVRNYTLFFQDSDFKVKKKCCTNLFSSQSQLLEKTFEILFVHRFYIQFKFWYQLTVSLSGV